MDGEGGGSMSRMGEESWMMGRGSLGKVGKLEDLRGNVGEKIYLHEEHERADVLILNLLINVFCDSSFILF